MSLLRAVGIGHRFGGMSVLDDVSLEVAAGELVVVVGPNGAGKTTLLRALSGVLVPDRGAVALPGGPSTRPRAEIAREVAVATQDRAYPFPYTVREVVAMGRAPFLGPFGRESPHDREIVGAALGRMGLVELAERAYPTLSSGEQQRVVLARALAQTPRLLLLDEPTAHMDLGHRVHTFEWLREWIASDGGARGVLLVTHDLVLAARYADRMVLLDRGRVVASGRPHEVLEPERIAEVYAVDVTVSNDADDLPVVVARRSRIHYTAAPDEPDR